MGIVSLANLRNRVTFERRLLVQDSVGGQSETWTTMTPDGWWAAIRALSGRELEAAQAIRALDSHEVIIRYLPGLTPKDRFYNLTPEGDVEYYNITNVDDVDMKHRFMRCTAEVGMAPG